MNARVRRAITHGDTTLKSTNPTPHTPTHAPHHTRPRLTFAHGLLIGALAAGSIVLVGAGSRQPANPIVGFAATDEKLFRVYQSGEIEFLGVDLDNGSLNGIPDWSPVKIDNTLIWDSRGRNFYKKK
jgi:hypothetical protein